MNSATDTGLHNTSTQLWTQEPLSIDNQIAIFLWKAWSPCLLVFGGFGNIATIFVMHRIKDNNSSQHVILMALAVSDFCLLYVSVLRQWLYYAFHVDMYDWHVVVCKMCWWLIYVSGSSSSWLLTFLTVQRTMAVKRPHKMRMACSLHRTRTIIVAILSTGCILHCHFLFGMVIREHRCTFRSAGYWDFITRVWAWVDWSTLALMPACCLMVCNVMLSMALYTASAASSSMAIHSVTNGNAAHINTARRKTASKTTVMSLALSCTFLVLTMPVCVYLIWDHYGYARQSQGSRLWTRKALSFALTMLLWYTNSAVNFLLYCFTGTKFRREFLNWICCRAQVHPNQSASSSCSGLSNVKKDEHY